MSTLDKIITLLKREKKTQRELCDYLGLNQQAFTGWKNGQTTSYKKYLPQIAKFFSVSVDALVGDADIEKAFNPIPVGVQGRRPIIGSLSAGLGTFAQEEILGWEMVDEQYNNDEYFYFRVEGDSMSPLINDGDLLLIRRQDSVDSGDIGAVVVDGEEGLIKRIKYDAEHIALVSLNPAYDPMLFLGEDVLRVRIVGKLVEMKRKF